MIPNYLKCAPSHPDAKCKNCKRPISQNKTTVYVKNSKDKACIYIPISYQELPMQTEEDDEFDRIETENKIKSGQPYHFEVFVSTSQRNQVLEEVAKEFDKMPFGDTAQSFATFVRGMKA